MSGVGRCSGDHQASNANITNTLRSYVYILLRLFRWSLAHQHKLSQAYGRARLSTQRTHAAKQKHRHGCEQARTMHTLTETSANGCTDAGNHPGMRTRICECGQDLIHQHANIHIYCPMCTRSCLNNLSWTT